MSLIIVAAAYTGGAEPHDSRALAGRLGAAMKCRSDGRERDSNAPRVRVTFDDSDSMQGFVYVGGANRYQAALDEVFRAAAGTGAVFSRLSDSTAFPDERLVRGPTFYKARTSPLHKFFTAAAHDLAPRSSRDRRIDGSIHVLISDLEQYPRTDGLWSAVDATLAVTPHIMIAAYKAPYSTNDVRSCAACSASERPFYVVVVAPDDWSLSRFARRLRIERNRGRPHTSDGAAAAQVFFATDPAIEITAMAEDEGSSLNPQWRYEWSDLVEECDGSRRRVLRFTSGAEADPLYVTFRVRTNAQIGDFRSAREETTTLSPRSATFESSRHIVDRSILPAKIDDPHHMHLRYVLESPPTGTVTYRIAFDIGNCTIEAPKWARQWAERDSQASDFFEIIERIIYKITRDQRVLTHYIAVSRTAR